MSLPQCIEGCPQHESTQQRGAYGPLILLRHKKQAQSRTLSKKRQGPGASRESRESRRSRGSRGVQAFSEIVGRHENSGISAGLPQNVLDLPWTLPWNPLDSPAPFDLLWSRRFADCFCRGEKRLKTRKNQKNAPGAVWLGHYAAACRISCAGGSSRTNGSGYPLLVPAAAHLIYSDRILI